MRAIRFSALRLIIILLAGSISVLGQANSLHQKIDQYMNPFVEGGVFSGNILIAREGKVVYQNSLGMANQNFGVKNAIETKFQIASISKMFTVVAILKLEEEGKLKITDKLEQFVSGIPNGDKITIEHLIRHRSGIVGDFKDFTRYYSMQETLDSIAKVKPSFEPNAKGSYSNHGYRLLAYIIEKVSGVDYGTFLKKNIFQPLKMENTGHSGGYSIEKNLANGYVPSGYLDVENAAFINWTSKTGNGSIFSTVSDLLKFDQALYNTNLLNAKNLQLLLAIGREHNTNKWNGGAPGFSATLDRYMDEKLTIIVLSNNYSTASRIITENLERIYHNQPYEQQYLVKGLKGDVKEYENYVGHFKFGDDFFFPGAEVSFVIKDEQLYSGGGRSAPTVLIPQGNNRYLDRNNWAYITFLRDDTGKIATFKWQYDRLTYTAKRIVK